MMSSLPSLPSLPSCSRYLIASAIFSIMLFISIFSYSSPQLPHKMTTVLQNLPLPKKSSGSCKNFDDVKNQTLGFSRVFAIALPERSDKRDSFSMAAALTGFKFDWIDGVQGDLMPEKTLPQGWNKADGNRTLGCWRAHMNAAQKIVKEQIPTALIFEDDADWDVNIKSQLVEFAKGSCYLHQNSSASDPNSPNPIESINSPYGDDWDLLWFGHCGAKNREDEDGKSYIIHDDPTAVPRSLWPYGRRQPNFNPEAYHGNFTRAVYEPVRGLCMFGYALSLRGAKRLLYHQSMAGFATVSDRALQKCCSYRYLGFKCAAPYPTMVGQHKGAGSTLKDSDRVPTEKEEFRKVGETTAIVYSTRLNMENLLAGGTKLKSQFPDRTMLDEVDLADVKIPEGEGHYFSKESYKGDKKP